MTARARLIALSPFDSIDARLRERLPDCALAAARDAADVRVLLLEGVTDTAPLVTALSEAGAFAYGTADGVVVIARRSTLERTRHVPGIAEAGGALSRAFERATHPPAMLRFRDRTLALDGPAHVMGILNVTPDSFFDRGRYAGLDAARARAAEMVEQGATVIDLGGQSHSAANPRIAEADERMRVLPVLEALTRDGLDAVLSIDTYRPAVAQAALAAGAHVVNDCSGLADPELAKVVARFDAGLVVMHLQGELNVRAARYEYGDTMAEVVDFLRERLDRAIASGVRPDALVADPGLEFGKEPATDLEILANFGDLRALGVPLLLAASRKNFLSQIYGRASHELLAPSLAAAAAGIAAGARLVRAHDVAETVELARLLAGVDRARAVASA